MLIESFKYQEQLELPKDTLKKKKKKPNCDSINLKSRQLYYLTRAKTYTMRHVNYISIKLGKIPWGYTQNTTVLFFSQAPHRIALPTVPRPAPNTLVLVKLDVAIRLP